MNSLVNAIFLTAKKNITRGVQVHLLLGLAGGLAPPLLWLQDEEV